MRGEGNVQQKEQCVPQPHRRTEPQARLQRWSSKADGARQGRILRAGRVLPEGFTLRRGSHQGVSGRRVVT